MPSLGAPAAGTWLYLWSVFGLSLTALLALEWLWRTAWSLVERWRPLASPWTFLRLITCALLIAVLVACVPDLWLLVRWEYLTPSERHLLAAIDRFLDGLVPLPFVAAWLMNFAGGRGIAAKLRLEPLPEWRLPGRRDVARLALILACVLAISAALTFAP